MKLLIVGSVAYDSIKTPFGKANKTLGGSATYFSLAASFFTKPSLVAVVGQDFKDEEVFKRLGINISGLEKQPGKTFAWGGEYSFDLNSRKTLFTHLNVFENFKPKLSSDHKKSKFVFLGNIHPSLQLDVLKQVNAPKFVGLDTMNLWIEKTLKDLKTVLKKVDILIINDSEARELSREHNLLKGAKKILSLMQSPSPSPSHQGRGTKNIPSPRGGGLGRGEKIVIIKRGEFGLLMFQKGNIFHLPGYPLEDVVDPTGAGDSFAGGFFGYLAKTDDISWPNLKKACVAGSVMASFCVEKLGTKRLLEIKSLDITQRLKDFKTLTHFEI